MLDLKRTLLPDRILTREEAAEFIGRSRRTIDRLVDKGALIPHNIGSTPEFLLSHILHQFVTDALASEEPASAPPHATQFQPKGDAHAR